MISIWTFVFALPLIVATLALFSRTEHFARWLLPFAPAPAFVLSVLGEQPGFQAPGLIFGVQFGLNAITGVFLFFTSLLWIIASAYSFIYIKSDQNRWRFEFFFALTMLGNLGLIVAQDIASFYTFFAVMTFSAYGLVIHDKTEEAIRAGRVYLGMALFGESLVLGTILMVAPFADNWLLRDVPTALARLDYPNLVMALAFAGFGVKAGALGLHFWLPLAHPVAPTPASAVLSGSMIKAGLLGWIYFLPLGQGSFPGWSTLLVILGFAAAFYAVMIGITQTDPKTNLAYSSISQMGIMTVAIGLGMSGSAAWAVVLPVLLFYAMNHAFAKGALFLGVGVGSATASPRGRTVALIGLALPALALAGAPWTGGAIAKYAFKQGAALAEQTLIDIQLLLTLSSVATAMLLTRFIWLVKAEEPHQITTGRAAGLWLPWAGLLVIVAGLASFAIPYFSLAVQSPVTGLQALVSEIMPIVVGLLLFIATTQLLKDRVQVRIPRGDIGMWIESLAHRFVVLLSSDPFAVRSIGFGTWLAKFGEREGSEEFGARGEERLIRWDVPEILLVILILTLTVLLSV